MNKLFGLITLLLLASCISAPTPTPVPTPTPTETLCTAEQRTADFCTQEYGPVCGWNDETIQCFRYPCASEYSNPCMACKNEHVKSWTPGTCPNTPPQ